MVEGIEEDCGLGLIRCGGLLKRFLLIVKTADPTGEFGNGGWKGLKRWRIGFD